MNKLGETSTQHGIDECEDQHTDREIGIGSVIARLGIGERRSGSGPCPFGGTITIEEIDPRTNNGAPAEADQNIAWEMNPDVIRQIAEQEVGAVVPLPNDLSLTDSKVTEQYNSWKPVLSGDTVNRYELFLETPPSID